MTGLAADPSQLAIIGMALLGVALLLGGVGLRRRSAITTVNHERWNREDTSRWWPD
ncbi:MAG TPA: hypothetical protein VFS96_04800 [Nitrolancea sp.]|nr:hypothetical protein [Nitrolancea sp.]